MSISLSPTDPAVSFAYIFSKIESLTVIFPSAYIADAYLDFELEKLELRIFRVPLE